jgi:hypothetical protein
VVDRDPNMSVEQPANGASTNSRHAASNERPVAGRDSLVAAICIVPSIKARSARQEPTYIVWSDADGPHTMAPEHEQMA